MRAKVAFRRSFVLLSMAPALFGLAALTQSRSSIAALSESAPIEVALAPTPTIDDGNEDDEASFAGESEPLSDAIVLRGVTIIDVQPSPALVVAGILSGGAVIQPLDIHGFLARRPRMSVVVAGDRIVAVGPDESINVPEGATVVDSSGRFLIPGLWDMHAHVTDPAFLKMFVANGVTSVRHMGSIDPRCRTSMWKNDVANGKRIGPRVVAADMLLDGPGSVFGFPGSLSVDRVTDADKARAAVRRAKEKGADFIKVHAMLSRESYFAATDECRKLNIPLAGHVPHSVTTAEAAAAGQCSIEHLTGVAVECAVNADELRAELSRSLIDGKGSHTDRVSGWKFQVPAHRRFNAEKAASVFARFVRHCTWHVPTLVQTRTNAMIDELSQSEDARLGLLPTMVRATWTVTRNGDTLSMPLLGIRMTASDRAGRKELLRGDIALVRAMHQAGVPLLAGTDCPNPYCFPGFSLHEELELLCEAGLTPLESLRCATLNPATFFGREAEMGTISEGKLADLVLLDSDPLESIVATRSVSVVIANGRLFERLEIEQMLGTEDSKIARNRE